jgi:hypothetical protein
MGLKVLLPVLLLVIIGGAVFAYFKIDSVRQMVSGWLPGKAAPVQQPTTTEQRQGTSASGQSAAAQSAATNTSAQAPAKDNVTEEKALPPSGQTASTRAPVQNTLVPPPAAAPRSQQTLVQVPAQETPPPVTAAGQPPAREDKPAPTKVIPPPPVVTQEPEKQPPPVEVAKPVTPPPVEPVAPPAKNPGASDTRPQAAQVPPRGTIQWTGEVNKDQTVTIEGGTASFGVLNGRLPRVPCTISVQTPDVTVAEAPGPSNAFDRIVLRFRKKGKISVVITWETLRQERP